jgi:hypothetical protein
MKTIIIPNNKSLASDINEFSNTPIDILQRSIKHLILGYRFNQEIDNSILNNLFELLLLNGYNISKLKYCCSGYIIYDKYNIELCSNYDIYLSYISDIY